MALRAAIELSISLYLLFRLCSFASFLFLSLETVLAERSAASENTLFGIDPAICSQVCGPHFLPRFCLSPAPMHLCSQEPLCDRLMTFPPSNLARICIQHSARFVVSFPISCSQVDLVVPECHGEVVGPRLLVCVHLVELPIVPSDRHQQFHSTKPLV